MVNGFFVLTGLIFILVILLLMKGIKRKPKQMIVYDYETFQPDTPRMTYQQYVEVLEWQFQMGIISVQEYNEHHQNGIIFLGVESN